jgi:hypothetical protein
MKVSENNWLNFAAEGRNQYLVFYISIEYCFTQLTTLLLQTGGSQLSLPPLESSCSVTPNLFDHHQPRLSTGKQSISQVILKPRT